MGGLDLLARDTSPGASRWWQASLTVRATLARGVGGRGLPLCSPSALSRGQHSSPRPPRGVGGQCRSRGEGGLPAAPWPEPEPRLHVKGHVLPAWATTRMGLGITLPSGSRRSKTKASRRHSCDARNPRTERNRLTKDRLTDIVDNLVGRGRGWGLGEWAKGQRSTIGADRRSRGGEHSGGNAVSSHMPAGRRAGGDRAARGSVSQTMHTSNQGTAHSKLK